MNNLELKKSNFTLWCDFIERGFLESEFGDLLAQNAFFGATSNPAIFSNAIRTSPKYIEQIATLKGKKSPKEIYENLAFLDIKTAAKILLPLYLKDKNDGFISIEIDPRFCNDAAKSIDEGRRIFSELDMPNVMIKVPATQAGFEVMEALAKEDININATLIFSPSQTKKCLESMRHLKGDVKGVISIFVSRFDRATKCNLEESLGIANASVCYKIIEDSNSQNIRALFASTGLKEADSQGKKCDFYLQNLAFENAINTAPLDSIKEFITKNNELKTPKSDDKIQKILEKYDTENLSQKLLKDGLESFVESFEEMLKIL